MAAAKKTTTKKTAAKKTAAGKPGRQPTDRKPKQSAKQQDAPEFEVAWTFEGRNYRITEKDLTAVEARMYRREMGESFMRTIQGGDLDVDVIATLMWLMDRRDDPSLAWEDVAAEVNYANIAQLDLDEGDAPSH